MRYLSVSIVLILVMLSSCSDDTPATSEEISPSPNFSQTQATEPPKSAKPAATTSETVPITENFETQDEYMSYITNLKFDEKSALSGIPNELTLAKTSYEFWDKKLNEIYSFLMDKLQGDEEENLRQEERLWVAGKMKIEMVDDSESLKTIYYNEVLDMTRRRTIELINLYYQPEFEEYYRKTYELKHEKDNSIYTVIARKDVASEYWNIQLFDAKSNLLQVLEPEIYFSENRDLEIVDFNSDGYGDFSIYTGGTLNETNDLYIWNASSKNFEKVIFEGFDMLAYFEAYDDYIITWLKDSALEVDILTLRWRGNVLYLESSIHHNFEEEYDTLN